MNFQLGFGMDRELEVVRELVLGADFKEAWVFDLAGAAAEEQGASTINPANKHLMTPCTPSFLPEAQRIVNEARSANFRTPSERAAASWKSPLPTRKLLCPDLLAQCVSDPLRVAFDHIVISAFNRDTANRLGA